MDFKSKAIKDLPKRATFGKAQAYSDEDVAAAWKVLAKPEAVSNGTTYDTKSAARNAGGTLRQNIIKRHEDAQLSVTAETVTEPDKDGNGGTFIFWVVPITKK